MKTTLILLIVVAYSGIIKTNGVEPNATQWKFKYFDEQAKGGQWLVREDSTDNRLANLLSVANFVSGNIIANGLHTLSGGREADLKLEAAMAGVEVDDGVCARQLVQMLSLMEDLEQILRRKRTRSNATELNETHFRLAQVLDSFGRYEAGAMAGRTLFLGSHPQCIGSTLILDNQHVELRQCLARFSLTDKVDLQISMENRSWFEADTQLSSAICIPRSCHSKSFRKHPELMTKLIGSQFKLPQSIYLREQLPIDSIYCSPDESSHLLKVSLVGWLFLGILLVWVALTICATYLSSKDTGREKIKITWTKHVQRSLDLKSSMREFVGSERQQQGNRVDLDMLNAIKVVGCFYVAFGHAIMISLNSAQNQLKAHHDLENDFWAYLAMSGTVVVDCFFLITGLMIGYLGTKRVLKEEVNGVIGVTKRCLLFAAARYMRLVPLYALVYYFKRLILTNINSSLPRWDHGLDQRTIIGACKQESWITPFTFMAAYMPLGRSCIPQSWSVAADMFFGLTLSPVVVLMSKRPRLVIPIVAGISAASAWSMLMGYQALDPNLRLHLSQMKMHSFARLFNEFTELYSMPHKRIFAAAVGSVAGYFLVQYGEYSKPKEWPRWFKGPVSGISLCLVVSLLLMPTGVPLLRHNLLKIYPLPQAVFDHAATTGRLVWCMAMVVVFLRLMTDWKDCGFWIQLNTGNFWKSMVRLNYPILLIHMDLQLMSVYSQTTVVYNSWHQMWVLFCSSYLTSVLLAVPLHVVFENPIDKLVKGFVQGYNNNVAVKEDVSEDKRDDEGMKLK